MVDRNAARAIVQTYLDSQRSRDRLAVWDEKTIERACGWVFFWQSEEFLRTGNKLHELLGGGPVLVDKGSGQIVVLAPVRVQEQLESYERQHRAVE